ncbi:unnamed protein product [Nezara viridula]|uniref:ENTH domain-containing protein n=1 Tax=Nezara viridula TaxID=85310 RepID=A0A9P0H350_NEZVI|nr:unnamed protein product [Nezara viridula]
MVFYTFDAGLFELYLIHCTNEPNVSIPQLANLLIERTQNTNWVVVFKALITVHHLMCYGNERFTQYLASSNSTFQLSNFLDKSGVQGYDMSPFIRRYAKYLNEKAMSYRTVAFDFCKVKRGKEDGVLRTMNAEKLLKTLPVLQSQLDELLEFDCSAADLSNGVINMAFMLLFRDLIRLFAGYNDSIINLLEKFFEMNKKQCRQALDLYKKFLIRMDRVGEFLKVAENVGIDKGEIPDLTKAPSSLLDALEQHLAALEGKKGSAANTPTQSASPEPDQPPANPFLPSSSFPFNNILTESQRTDVKSGVSALCSTSSAFGTAAAAHGVEGGDDALRQQALAEEEAAINHYKSKVQSPTNSGAATATNPFLVGSPTQPIVDLFGAPVPAAEPQVQQTGKASDDLLQLGNPFADIFGAPAQQVPLGSAPPPVQPAVQNNMWMSNGFGAMNNINNSAAPPSSAFVSDNAFNSVFGSADQPAATAPDNIYVQAAAGEVNPFAGEGKAPPRPPPPRPASPPKSALDDLSNGIRAAMGQSQSTPQQPPPQQQPFQQQPPSQQSFQQPTQFQQPPPAPQAFPQPNYPQPGPGQVFQQPTIPGQTYQPPVVGGQAFQQPVVPGQTFQQTQPVMFASSSSPAKVPMAAMQAGNEPQSGKVLTGDLDTSLALLAENLTINKGTQQTAKGMQWNSPKNAAKPGTGWTPQPMAATTGANYRPMGPGMMSTPTFASMHHMGMMGSPRQVPPQAQQPQELDPFGAL